MKNKKYVMDDEGKDVIENNEWRVNCSQKVVGKKCWLINNRQQIKQR
jgi:hypothetical protein